MKFGKTDARAVEAEIPYLRRYARALIGNPDAADDLVQDALERAIARFLVVEVGTVKSRVFRARESLRYEQLRLGRPEPPATWRAAA